MSDAVSSTEYLTYSQDLVNGIGVAGPSADAAQPYTEQAAASSEEIENIDEDIGRNVDVVV